MGILVGRFKNQHYYPGKDDGELQWLEDGIGLVGTTLVGSLILAFCGIFQICRGIFALLAGDESE